jgi:hypothetical protein
LRWCIIGVSIVATFTDSSFCLPIYLHIALTVIGHYLLCSSSTSPSSLFLRHHSETDNPQKDKQGTLSHVIQNHSLLRETRHRPPSR